jgi:orotate phosphoribosyltransferase-like protein
MTVMDKYLTVEEVAQELKVSQDLETYVEAQKKKQAE